LNLIERLWKFFKKKVLYTFKAACEDFFRNPSQYRGELRTLLTENFAIKREFWIRAAALGGETG
jgi:hypothetical protein